MISVERFAEVSANAGVSVLLDDFGVSGDEEDDENDLATGEAVVLIVMDERFMLGQDFKTCCINNLQADSTISLLLLNVSSFEALSKLSSFDVFTILKK